MADNNPMATIDQIIELAAEAKGHADKLYNKNVKSSATKYRNTLMEINKLIKDERPRALEHQKSISAADEKKSGA